ncbi:MAG: hypothetical protein OHK0023_12970 [Anaerolineae bacterium]
MTIRQLVLRLVLMAIVSVAILSAVIALSAAPTSTAKACVPCLCENDQRHNCIGHEFYAVYTKVVNNVCRYEAFSIENSKGKRQFIVTQAELDRLPEFPETNTLIKASRDGSIAMYKLTSGEYQVNAGPDKENKVYVVIMKGCPAEVVREEVFVSEAKAK